MESLTKLHSFVEKDARKRKRNERCNLPTFFVAVSNIMRNDEEKG